MCDRDGVRIGDMHAVQHPTQKVAAVDSNASIAEDAVVLLGKVFMATLTIRNVDTAVKEKLRVRAARNGRSMEAELRAIVADAIGATPQSELDLAEAIRRRFAPFGGVELELPPRLPDREPPRFD
jgi:plasmid stability protein